MKERLHQTIGLGDLIHAARRLAASDDELPAIAALLGFRPPQLANEPPPPTKPIGPGSAANQKPFVDTQLTSQGAADAEPTNKEEPSEAGEYELVSEAASKPQLPSWLTSAPVLVHPDEDPAEDPASTGPEPLLSPTRTRAILSAAAAARTSDGPIDIERLIEALARRRLLPALPRQMTETLSRGAQILIDRSTSMQPFHRDADDLAQQLQQVASLGTTEILYFDETPELVDATWPVGEGRAHAMPAAGVPIVILTDLGIRSLPKSRPRAHLAWLQLAVAARRVQCPLLAFIPYPPSRWPQGLDGLMTMLPWDRSTTVALVRAARRAGRR